MFRYQYATVAGTFDRLHKGHASILEHAFSVAKKVYIALSSDEFARKKSSQVLPYSVRKQELEDYLQINGYEGRYFIKPLSDIYGDSLKDKDLDAIIVTKDTAANARKINELRQEKNIKPLTIEVVALLKNDHQKTLSSTFIRGGVMDRRGNEYTDLFAQKLSLPEDMREELRKPLGQVFENTEKLIQFIKAKRPTKVIAVGDIIVQSLKDADATPDFSIVDLKSRRKEIKTSYNGKKVPNPAGTITEDAASRMLDLGSSIKRTLVIDGEEDLLAIPAILMAPLESVVVYGHFEHGIVAVEVTEQEKQRLQLEVLDRFLPSE